MRRIARLLVLCGGLLAPQFLPASDAPNAVALYQQGLSYRAQGEERKAAAALAQAVDQGLRTTAAWMHLIEAAFASRQSALGVERAQQWMSTSAVPPQLLLRVGKLLFGRLFYRDARDAFQAAAAGLPDDREARFFLAMTEHLLNAPQRAMDALQPLMRNQPTGEVVTLYGAAQAQAGLYAEALETLRSALDSPHARLNLALLFLQQDRLADAAVVLTKLRTDGAEANAKVFFHVSRDFCEAAVTDAQQPAADRQAAAEYLLNLSEQLAAGYHYGAALQLARLAMREGGASPAALYAAGRACFNLAPQAAAAASLLKQTTAADAQNAPAWHLLSRLYYRQGDFRQAAHAAERAVQIHSRPDYLASLGRAQLALGEEHADAARKSFDSALSLDNRDAQVHYYAARAYSALGRTQTAKDHLLQAVELEPDFYEAYYMLGLVCAKLQEREESTQYLKRFEHYRTILKRQSVVDNGYLSEGREP